MSKTALQFAAWIAAISAVLTIPLFAAQVIATRSGPTTLSMTMQITNVLLLLYVLASLRALLEQKQAPVANSYLTAIMIVSVILQFGALIATPEDTYVLLVLFGGLVALGVLYIVVGIKLLATESVLPGLKLFCCAAIAVGTFTASIVLALAALPASMVMDFALAIVFFRAAAQAPAALTPAQLPGTDQK